MFLVLKSAAIFKWEMGWVTEKKDITRGREAGKQKGCGGNKPETSVFTRRRMLMQQQDWWKHRGVSGEIILAHKMM